MKSRRVIITIEAETDLPLADLRNICGVIVREGRNCQRVVSDDRFVTSQVQVNAIRSEPQPRSQRARMAKFAKEDAERADPKRPGWFSDRIAEVQTKPERDARYWRSIGKEVERKAKRAKGAK